MVITASALRRVLMGQRELDETAHIFLTLDAQKPMAKIRENEKKQNRTRFFVLY
jgi:hypothetical protein